jgi:CheY-like chemotaxis protein
LLFDPHVPSRTITSLVLSTRGHVCEHADSTAAAIAAFDAFRPDVVIYEWDVRGDDASGLARQFRARAETDGRALVVIAVSAADEPIGFCEREELDAYFTKPVFATELERAFG